MTENPYPVSMDNRPMISAQDVNPVSMMFDPIISGRCLAIAETLAKGRVSVPDHLRGNTGDCLAIVMQAASWRLNPFAVAQKTYLIHGRLGYEAQLVSAVVSSLRIIDGRFSYEYIGEWDRLAVPPIIGKSAKGFDIPTPGWNTEDETGLALVVSAKMRGDDEMKTHKLTLASVWPRNSTLWATNPRQQASYLATKQWVRLYAPDAILGVYTVDELEQQPERIVTGERVPENTTQAIMDDARKVEDTKPAEFSDEWFKDKIANATMIQELNDIGEMMAECDSDTTELTILWKKRIDEIGSTVHESQTEPDITSEPSASSQEKPPHEPKNKKLEWPKELHGYLVDARGVIWDERIHSSGRVCTQEGIWRRRRGIMKERADEVEKTLTDIRAEKKQTESEKPTEQMQTHVDSPLILSVDNEPLEMFSEKWFLTRISQANTEQDLDEYLDLIREVDLHPGAKWGIEQKIAAQRAKLQQSEIPL